MTHETHHLLLKLISTRGRLSTPALRLRGSGSIWMRVDVRRRERSPGRSFTSSDFVPDGALFTLAFVTDHITGPIT